MTIDLEAIKAREKAATEGPWRHSPSYAPPLKGDGSDVLWGYSISGSNEHGGSILPMLGSVHNFPDHMEANAEFIAHARQDIPALIAEVERLTAACANIAANDMNDVVLIGIDRDSWKARAEAAETDAQVLRTDLLMEIDARKAAEAERDRLYRKIERAKDISDRCINAEHYTTQDALEDLTAIRSKLYAVEDQQP